MVDIFNLNKSEISEDILNTLKTIFYESSHVKEFTSQEKKEQFFKTWMDYYIDTQYPGKILVATDGSGIIGYLTYCTDSQQSESYYLNRNVNTRIFNDLFITYPAHLHINLSPSCRNKGVGSRLITQCLKELKSQGIRGVHLITVPGERNVNFYKKNNFLYTEQRNLNSTALLFMGRKI